MSILASKNGQYAEFLIFSASTGKDFFVIIISTSHGYNPYPSFPPLAETLNICNIIAASSIGMYMLVYEKNMIMYLRQINAKKYILL